MTILSSLLSPRQLTSEPKAEPSPHSTKPDEPLRLSLTALIVIFLAFLIAVLQTPIFDFDDSAPSATVVAAALTLIGGLFGTIVTGAGLVLKHSIDIRTEKRLEVDTARNAALQTDAEQRLALEAGIKAVQLLATSTGQPSPPIQQAGALFTLVSLRQYDLASELVIGLMEANQINPDIATGVLDGVIRLRNTDSSRNALTGLSVHAEKLVTKRGVAMPLSITNGTRGFDRYSRQRIYVTLARVLLAQPLSEWNQEKLSYQANSLLASLCLCWLDESEVGEKADVGAVLWRVLAAPFAGGLGDLHHPRQTIHTEAIRIELEEIKPSPQSDIATSLVQRAEAWARGEIVCGPVTRVPHEQVVAQVEGDPVKDSRTRTGTP